MLHIPLIFKDLKEISAAQSLRQGGVSTGVFESLNLGKSTADAPELVDENRRRFFEMMGFNPDAVALSHQVHGTAVFHARKAGSVSGFDALITAERGLLVAVSIADCTPILIFDKKNKAVAAIHAGWKGTAGGVVSKTVETMHQAFGTAGEDCWAFVGACISERVFEVGEEVAIHFSPRFRRWDAERGKFFVDLKGANRQQLLDFGVPTAQIEVSDGCTFSENHLYFSHRRERGNTGRMLAAIGLL